MYKYFLFFLIFLFSFISQGKPIFYEFGNVSLLDDSKEEPVTTIRTYSETFNNTNCKETNTCDLKSAKMIITDYKVGFEADNDFNFGTQAILVYETDTKPNLLNYVYVQFIKGCMFDSKLVDGKVTKIAQGYSVYSFDDIIPLKFTDWVIDSSDKDPVYSTDYPDHPERHYYYYWAKYPEDYSQEQRRYYGDDLPYDPWLYINVLPGQAWYSLENGYAINNSLQFKTCLYRETEVPRPSIKENINFATPIHCFTWKSSWVYNHKTKKFENPSSIDPVCLH